MPMDRSMVHFLRHATGRRTRWLYKLWPLGNGLVLEGVRRDGSVFSLEISLNPFTLIEVLSTIATVRDVSSKVETEKRLLQAERTSPSESTDNALRETSTIAALRHRSGCTVHPRAHRRPDVAGAAPTGGGRPQANCGGRVRCMEATIIAWGKGSELAEAGHGSTWASISLRDCSFRCGDVWRRGRRPCIRGGHRQPAQRNAFNALDEPRGITRSRSQSRSAAHACSAARFGSRYDAEWWINAPGNSGAWAVTDPGREPGPASVGDGARLSSRKRGNQSQSLDLDRRRKEVLLQLGRADRPRHRRHV